MPELFAGRSDELPEGGRVIITNGCDRIGVVRVKGNLHAFLNICPHQGGPVCEGMMIHRVEEIIGPDKTYQGMRFNEDALHVVCPWHGWEFDVETGRCAGDGEHALKRFAVVERGGDVYVVVS
jgi:nitrite reductase (NADH) small subunit